MRFCAVIVPLSKLFVSVFLYFFFFKDTATTEIYTLSLHDALPIYGEPVYDCMLPRNGTPGMDACKEVEPNESQIDRKSTRLNSSHANISYAVFCLKKKKLRVRETGLYKGQRYLTARAPRPRDRSGI